jgi:hypothetical protein
MPKVNDMETRIEDTIKSIDNIGHALPKPFFYTRLEAALARQQRNVWEDITRVISRPAIAIVTLSLILALNIFVVIEGNAAVKNVSTGTELANADDLRPTSFYGIENIQP